MRVGGNDGYEGRGRLDGSRTMGTDEFQGR